MTLICHRKMLKIFSALLLLSISNNTCSVPANSDNLDEKIVVGDIIEQAWYATTIKTTTSLPPTTAISSMATMLTRMDHANVTMWNMNRKFSNMLAKTQIGHKLQYNALQQHHQPYACAHSIYNQEQKQWQTSARHKHNTIMQRSEWQKVQQVQQQYVKHRHKYNHVQNRSKKKYHRQQQSPFNVYYYNKNNNNKNNIKNNTSSSISNSHLERKFWPTSSAYFSRRQQEKQNTAANDDKGSSLRLFKKRVAKKLELQLPELQNDMPHLSTSIINETYNNAHLLLNLKHYNQSNNNKNDNKNNSYKQNLYTSLRHCRDIIEHNLDENQQEKLIQSDLCERKQQKEAVEEEEEMPKNQQREYAYLNYNDNIAAQISSTSVMLRDNSSIVMSNMHNARARSAEIATPATTIGKQNRAFRWLRHDNFDFIEATVMSLQQEQQLQSQRQPSKAQRLFTGLASAGGGGVTQHWHWPIKREAVVEGELILGGLMMVHSREDTIICGPIMPQGGIQALEAMLYTIDRINESGLLPNITLGAHVLDDCDKDTYGLEMAVDFIKGSISNIDDTEYYCNKTQVRKVISGVVGASSSVTSIQVANLLRLFRIPQVSFFSTSPELSNKQRFEYFTRTIPSDLHQVKAMVEIVKRLGWSYVSIIYEESNYGIKAFEELEELLALNTICIAVKEKLVKDSGVAEEIAYDNIVQKLLTKPRARGAIIFGSDQEVREVMRAVRRNNATGAFSWIGSDGWSARNLVSDGNEPEVEGTLSVQPQANPVKGFEEYFLNLTVENNQRNPWFIEFWEDHFQCRYPNSPSTPYNSYNHTCSTKEQLTSDNTDFEDQLQFVSDAVMAFAYALRDMHHDLCGGKPTLCEEMKPTKGADLLKYLRKVQFQGLSGDNFLFDENGDGPARYNIIHFKQSKEGQYHWVKIGEYYEGELRLNMSEVQFKLLNPKPPESVCSLPCESGQAKKYVEGESCCWHCFNCSMYQIRDPWDETQCQICPNGTLPNSAKQLCVAIPEVYLRLESAWAIGAMTFSSIGIMLTLFIVSVFVRHNDTPIVRASGRELTYILLAGILMCYAVTFALVLKPTNFVCAIQRFSVGFCFTVVYAALLTKTNRIARIFTAGKQSAKRPSFISPNSQLVICSFLIFIQILINGIWMIIAQPHAMHHHPTREDNLLVCDSYIDASYMIAFFYPIVLIVICTVYAVLTRKIPEAFNESKHIGFTMYTTCVIWLAFVPLYFGTANHVPLRITSMSVTISLSASVTIACLFSPKLYIMLIHPERNVRQSMMPPRYGNIPRSATSGPSSMMAAAVVTAATCAQEENIQQHITPTSAEPESTNKRKLCEMATQTITLSNIFITLDSNTYNAIPYADQCMPNNTKNQILRYHQPLEGQILTSTATTTTTTTTATATEIIDLSVIYENTNALIHEQVVGNNNDIRAHIQHDQQQIVNGTTMAGASVSEFVKQDLVKADFQEQPVETVFQQFRSTKDNMKTEGMPATMAERKKTMATSL